jgi:TonB-dependent receptor
MFVLSSVKKILSIVIFIPIIALSQASLKGTVTDAANNETLIGVNVVIMGTSLGAATDIEGQYRIIGIPARILSVKFSCIGYEAQVKEIDFSKTNDAVMDAKLKSAVIQGEEVVVTAQMRGQNAAINQQITSNSIINVVSEEKIKELPDANAAEAIGRLPGVSITRSGGEASRVVLRGLSSKFSNITIDGVKIPPTDPNTRDVDLSTISQGSLAGIELFKALTADKDADAIAGTVNLVTRKAPSERLLQVDLKGGYNHLMKSANQYDFSGRYGERFFNDVVGIQLQGNIEKKIRSRERTDYDYSTPQDITGDSLHKNYYMNNAILEFVDEVRKRDGAGAIIDINTPDSGLVKISAAFSSTNRNYQDYTRRYISGHANDVLYQARLVEQETGTFNSSLQGKNYLFGFDIQWSLAYAQSKVTNPYDYEIRFLEPSRPDAGVRSGTPDTVYTPQYMIDYAWNNFTAATCSTAFYRGQNNFDKERTASLDITKQYFLGSMFSGELKVGGKYKEKNRWMDQKEDQAYYWVRNVARYNTDGTEKAYTGTRFADYFSRLIATGDKSPLASEFLSDPVPTRNIFGQFTLTPLLDPDAIRLWYAMNKNGTDEYFNNPLTAINGYNVIERVTSGYIMNTLNIGQSITLNTGLRVEKELNEYQSKWTPDEAAGFPVSARLMDTSATYTETIWLPNFHLSIRPTDFLTIRLAAYRALARPDFTMRLERYSADKQNGNLLVIGNSHLRDAKAWNYETNISFFSNTLGLISLSAFYKEIDDMYHQMSGIAVAGDSILNSLGNNWVTYKPTAYTNYSITSPYNSASPTKAWGIEFEHQMNTSFLSGYLQYFVLSYNISVTRSETYILTATNYTTRDTVIKHIPIPPPNGRDVKTVVDNQHTRYDMAKRNSEGQPELYGNVALGYDIGGTSIRVSVFFQDEYNQYFSPNGASDIVTNAYNRWDLAFKQKITDKIEILANVSNLTNVKDVTTMVDRVNNWRLTDTQELYGTTVDVGVRITL